MQFTAEGQSAIAFEDLARGTSMSLKRLFVLFVLSLLLLPSSPLSQDRRIVKEIVVVGNRRVQRDVILSEIKSKVGQPLDRELLKEDVKALWRLGNFLDVRADVKETPEGVILTFVVLEKPVIKELVISGHERIERDEIEEVLKLKEGDFFDPEDLSRGVEAVKKLYHSKGYYGVEISSEVEEAPENQVVVYIDIVEGVKAYIKEIRFEGNRAFSSRKLRKLMRTKKKGWLSWLTKTGTLEREVLEVDLARIKSFYHDHGYLTVKVSEPEITLSRDGRSITITIRIEEGDRFRVGSIDLKGDLIAPKEELLKGFKTKVGKWYRSSLVQKDMLRIVDYYADRGYAYVDVSPLTSLDRQRKLVHLLFKVDRGPKVYIGRIEISGNTKTRDKVIRRELKVAEGELYSATKLRKSRQRIKRLGIFKEVDLSTTPTERKEVLDLEVKVQEQQTGMLQFGAGYSSVYGVVGTVALSERNLFGRAWRAYIRATLGGGMSDFSLGMSDPRFLDTSYSVGFDAFNETYDYDTYDSRVTGGDLKVGRELTDYLRADLVYRYERVKIYNVEEEASSYIKSQEGTTDTSKVTLTLTFDNIDDPLNPTRGIETWFSVCNAGGPLGGDNYFWRVSTGASWFHPLIGDLVLNLRGRFGLMEGYSGREVPLGEKFYVGGLRTLRGFEYGMAGPVDENREPIGSLKMAVLNVEFIYPLSKALGLKAAVFYDVGKGFDDWSDITPLRHAAGVGIRWYSPFGPIRIDWGYNLNRRKGEKASVWDFAVGMMY